MSDRTKADRTDRSRGPAPRSGFKTDTRGIEGLPIRLVIALVVGVASLSVMMSMIQGIGTLGVSELDANPDPEVMTADKTDTVAITVVDHEGTPVADATVILQGQSARLPDGIVTDKTDSNGVVKLSVTPELGPNQRQGTLSIDIKPPSGSEYADQRANTEVLVLEK